MPDDAPKRSSLLAALRKDARYFRKDLAQLGIGYAGWIAAFAPVEMALTCAEYLAPGRESAAARFFRHVIACLITLQVTQPSRKRAA